MKTELKKIDIERPAVNGPHELTISGDRIKDTTMRLQQTAIVYCEGNFAKIDGKTANGLIRHSEAYRIVGVVDSAHAGKDSGLVLDNKRNDIPIYANLNSALSNRTELPDTLIYGMAPSTGKLSLTDRDLIISAIKLGMNVVCGLHEYLCDDFEIAKMASIHNVSLHDIRKPKSVKNMRLFDGSIAKVKAIRIAILGTDCAIGKRTTATVLAHALNAIHIKTILVGTGQTGLMQGAKYGIAMDAIPPQFCCGELEREIIAAENNEQPKIILIEGQGALGHPAFCTSAFILRGSQPHAVILQHAPKRKHRCDFPTLPMPDPAREIAMIEMFSNTRVIGVTLNHEGMCENEITNIILEESHKLALPVADALRGPLEQLLDIVFDAYPKLVKDPQKKIL